MKGWMIWKGFVETWKLYSLGAFSCLWARDGLIYHSGWVALEFRLKATRGLTIGEA